ncbi:HI1506-related protein [Shewanella sp. 3B26]|uniref:HI1506-related protein n=1 Tax=Shewanella zhuhaiensis TaxID=2919576 RepID=A0AAJ1BJ18_9GAMM|nr:HI1506-related protein [Shewanella zhuhaiensis]MCH4295572.1 HI1506-related protein [Shewanella zhuhaiensis]
MANPTISKLAVLIAVCLAHDGYRRAGLSFKRGENKLDPESLSEDQVAALEADPRILLELRSPDGEPVPQSALVSAPGSLDTANGDKALSFAEAVATLEPDNREHFTSGGKPQLEVLGKLMGKTLTAAERDAQWLAYQAAAGSGATA